MQKTQEVFNIRPLTSCIPEKEGGGNIVYHVAPWAVPSQRGCPALDSNTPASRRVILWHRRTHRGCVNKHDTWIIKMHDHIVTVFATMCTRSIRKLVCHTYRAEPLANGQLCFWILPLLKSAMETFSSAFSREISTAAVFLDHKNILRVW